MGHVNVSRGIALLTCVLVACSNGDAKPSGTAGSTGNGGAAGASGSGTDASMGGAGAGGSNMTEAGAIDAKLCGTMTCPVGATCKDGGCACPGYLPDTCDGTCVDMKLDPQHCGMCPIQCAAGATCNAGVCGPTPTTVVPSAAGCDTLHLAMSGATLFWTDKGHNMVKGLATGAGGAAMTVASNQKSPGAIVATGTALFWINGGDNTVMRASLADVGAPTALVTLDADAGTDALGAIAVSGSTLYYSDVDKIYQMPTAGGAATLVGIAQKSGVVGSMAVSALNIYYPTRIHNDVEIMSLAPGADGGAQTSRVAESQGSLYYDTILLLGNQLYWANGDGLYTGNITGGMNTSTVTHTAHIGPVTGFVVGTTSAYVGEAGDSDASLGYVERAPLDVDAASTDGTATVIARGQKSPNSFVLDGTKVYWSTGDVAADSGAGMGCMIMSLPQ